MITATTVLSFVTMIVRENAGIQCYMLQNTLIGQSGALPDDVGSRLQQKLCLVQLVCWTCSIHTNESDERRVQTTQYQLGNSLT